MVISSIHNLLFRIHSKKLQEQNHNSFHHILILQTNTQHEHIIHYRSLCFFILL